MTTFQAEDWEIIRDEIISNWPAHYQEAYGDNDYSPNFEQYDTLALLGNLVVVTARRDDELVGYVVAFLQPHLHQRNVLWGSFDSYWVRKDCRAPRFAPRLLQAASDFLRKSGARKLFATEKIDGRLFAHLGWRAAERVYVKEL